MTTPSTATVCLPNYISNVWTKSAVSTHVNSHVNTHVNTHVNKEQLSMPTEWYVLTNRDLTAAKTELVYRLDAEIFEASQSLSHIYKEEKYNEEEQQSEFDFLDEEPIVYFPPTQVGTFTMEVTQKLQGQVEATFTLDDLEHLIDVSDM